jgi:hypothetical protein
MLLKHNTCFNNSLLQNRGSRVSFTLPCKTVLSRYRITQVARDWKMTGAEGNREEGIFMVYTMDLEPLRRTRINWTRLRLAYL